MKKTYQLMKNCVESWLLIFFSSFSIGQPGEVDVTVNINVLCQIYYELNIQIISLTIDDHAIYNEKEGIGIFLECQDVRLHCHLPW